MAQDVKDTRIVIEDDQARAELLAGAELMYRSVTKTFGPRGMNVMAEKPFGRALLTRDGVTVSRETYFKDRAKNIGAQMLNEASETTNRIAGDGTTATVALAYHLLKYGNQAIAAGKHPMEVKDMLLNDSYVLLDALEKIKKPIKKSQLKDVASVSSGDVNLGQMIAEAIQYVGPNGGILTEKAPIWDIQREYINGYYLQNGFEAIQQGKIEINDPFVVVCSKKISSISDVATILNTAAKLKNHDGSTGLFKMIFIGNIEGVAYNHIIELINKPIIEAIVIKTPPQFGDMGTQVLDDIATYAGCEAIKDSVDLRGLLPAHIGKLDRAVGRRDNASLFADNSTELVQTRVQEIKDQLAVETVDQIAERFRDRIAKLEGKIALFKIGGATETTKEEKEFRIDDAIHATRSAYEHGVVVGGGITLLQLSKCNISEVYRKSLESVFKQLLDNANLPSELKLNEALHAPEGYGFDLRKKGELVDLVKEGILDPAQVVEQIIKNSTQAAADALTIGTLLVFQDKPEK